MQNLFPDSTDKPNANIIPNTEFALFKETNGLHSGEEK